MRTFARLEESHLPDVLNLWERFFPERYHIDLEILKLNTIQSPLFDWGISGIAFSDGKPIAMTLFKRSAAPRLYAGDQDQAHLSAIAFSEVDAAVDLMAEAKHMLLDRGQRTLVFGADSRHFLPGCPEDMPLLRSFLTVEGFDFGDDFHDLERDLATYQNPYPAPDGLDIRILAPGEERALKDFLNVEFPGRWAWDVGSKVMAEGVENCAVAAFLAGRMVGFALIQDQSCTTPVAGAVWRKSLGPNWGALGPIGVAAAMRGRGLGNAVLGGALEILRDRGARRTIIDWTNLAAFYGGHGFEVTRTYRSASLVLG